MSVLTFHIMARDDASRVFDRLGRQLDGLGGRFDKFGRVAAVGATAAAAGVGAGLGAAITKAASFDKTIRQVGVATGQGGKALKELSNLALKTGQDTVFSAKDASQAMFELAKGGMTAAQIKGGALQGTMTLAAAGELDMAQAATYLGDTLHLFGLEAKDANRVVAAMAGGANASSASVERVGYALAQVGPGAKLAGMSLESTVGVLSAFHNSGLKGSDAGTSFKTMLARLEPQTNKAAKAMDALGLDFTDASGNFLPLRDIAEQLRVSLEKLSPAQKTQALNTIFGSDAYRAAALMSELGAKGVDKYTRATSDAGAAQKLANVGMQGAAGAIQNFKGSVETLTIQLGLHLLPAFTKLLNFVNKTVLPAVGKLIERFGEFVKRVGPDVQAVFQDKLLPALQVIGALVTGVLIPALGNLAGFVSSHSAGFQALAAAVLGGIIAFKLYIGIVKTIRAVTMAWTVAQAALSLVMSAHPVGLLVVAIGALIGTLIVAYKNSETFRRIVDAAFRAVKAAAEFAFNWIRDNWKLLLTIVTGPIGLAVRLVVQHWDRIKSGALSVVSWVRQNWPLLLGVITGPIGLAVVAVTKNWDRITAGAKAMRDTIGEKISEIVGFVKGLPGRVVGAIGNLGKLLVGAGGQLITGLKSGITGGLSKIGTWVKDNIVTPIANSVKLMFGIGKTPSTVFSSIGGQLISGLRSGIINSLKAIGQWIKAQICDPIVGAVRKFFDMRSPSKVFQGIGGDLVKGLLKGMLDEQPTKIIGKIFGGMPEALRAIVNKGMIAAADLSGKALAALTATPAGLRDARAGLRTGDNRALVKALAAEVGWTGRQWTALERLIQGESGFSNTAQNPSTAAYGMFQFLDSTWASVGARKTSDPFAQTLAGFRYITQRYGTPAAALAAWQSRSPHWYARGGVIAEPVFGVGRSGQSYVFGERGPETVVPGLPGRGDAGGVTNNITIQVHAGVGDPAAIGRTVVHAVGAYLNRGGTLPPRWRTV